MKISEAESKILEVFWDATGPLTAEDVVATMNNARDWSAGTIRTFLARLVKKEALAVTPDGRRYLYTPLLQREDYVHEQSRNLINSLFGGSVAPFIAHFSERENLSSDDITELKRLVRRLERER